MTSSAAPDGSDEPSVLGDLDWREALRRFAELAAFCGFAIAQPVLQAFGNSPEQFVFRGLNPTEIIVFALVVVLAPPILIGVATLTIARISNRVGRFVHVAVLAVLAGLAAIQLGWRSFDLTSTPLLLLALVAGVLVAVLYVRTRGFRVWLRYTAVLPIAAMMLFVFGSPVADLVRSRTVDSSAVEFGQTPPIVVLVFDELPTATLVGADGAIDADLFPNFARMSELGTWYRNNSTNSNNTLLAVPSMLTGRVPAETQATLANHQQNLYTLLGNTYDIRADEAPVDLCPENICDDISISSGGLGKLLGDARRLWRSQVSISNPGGAVFNLLEETVAVGGEDADSPTAEDVFASAFSQGEQLLTSSPARQAAFLEAIQPSNTPTLNYLHLQLPHGPFRFYANGAEYWRPNGAHDTITRYDTRGDSSIPADVYRQRHVLQTQFADALLGQMLDRLEDQDLLEESIVIVAADHGISFEPGVTPRLNIEDTLPPSSLDDVFWSALFMKESGQLVGGVSDAPTQLIDVLPTLISWLDADPGWELDGQPVSEVDQSTVRSLCRPVARDTSIGVDCLEVSGNDVLDELLASAVGNFLPAEESDLRVYRTGPSGDLVGQALDAMEIGDPSQRKLAVQGLERFDDVRVGEPLPGLIAAKLASGDNEVAIALVLNGTIAAVTESFTGAAGSGRVAALLPRSMFVAGANELEVYVVDQTTDSPTLHAAEVSAG